MDWLGLVTAVGVCVTAVVTLSHTPTCQRLWRGARVFSGRALSSFYDWRVRRAVYRRICQSDVRGRSWVCNRGQTGLSVAWGVKCVGVTDDRIRRALVSLHQSHRITCNPEYPAVGMVSLAHGYRFSLLRKGQDFRSQQLQRHIDTRCRLAYNSGQCGSPRYTGSFSERVTLQGSVETYRMRQIDVSPCRQCYKEDFLFEMVYSRRVRDLLNMDYRHEEWDKDKIEASVVSVCMSHMCDDSPDFLRAVVLYSAALHNVLPPGDVLPYLDAYVLRNSVHDDWLLMRMGMNSDGVISSIQV